MLSILFWYVVISKYSCLSSQYKNTSGKHKKQVQKQNKASSYNLSLLECDATAERWGPNIWKDHRCLHPHKVCTIPWTPKLPWQIPHSTNKAQAALYSLSCLHYYIPALFKAPYLFSVTAYFSHLNHFITTTSHFQCHFNSLWHTGSPVGYQMVTTSFFIQYPTTTVSGLILYTRPLPWHPILAYHPPLAIHYLPQLNPCNAHVFSVRLFLDCLTLNIKELWSFKTLITTYPTT